MRTVVRVKFADYLNAFSIEDLRELALRRRLILSPAALQGRQTLVRALASALESYQTTYPALYGANQAEIAALRFLLDTGTRKALSALCASAGIDPATGREVLDGLRLRGLVFPEGDWEHIVIPQQTRQLQYYLTYPGKQPGDVKVAFTPPPIETAAAACRPRPGSSGWDLAEFLARVARARFKLTQARRFNRRDLRSMESAFTIPTAGYVVFLSILAGALDLIVISDEDVLEVPEEVDVWLPQPEEVRAKVAVAVWRTMAGYPEGVSADPGEYDYMPPHLPDQRGRMMELAAALEPGAAATIDSLARRLAWLVPLSFQQYGIAQDSLRTTAQLARSLYWLGILAVDDPEEPAHAQLTPLGARALGRSDGIPALVPEEPHFFLQPNAEAFAPPNLSPRTLFHLRRITGEKKGAPAGTYPLNADSLRRALDSGLTVAQITTFLDRFSRTGLPDNVRNLVETAGRQHGRIRLVPTGYALVTDEPALLQELQSIKTIAPLLGARLAERVAAVDEAKVPELLRKIRARGYAPLNQAETGAALGLPDDPGAPVPEIVIYDPRTVAESAADVSLPDDESDELPEEAAELLRRLLERRGLA